MNLPPELVTNGNRRESLQSMREFLTFKLKTCNRADAIAPIARQLTEIIKQIDELPNENEKSVTDELNRAREARRKAATNAVSAEIPNQRGK